MRFLKWYCIVEFPKGLYFKSENPTLFYFGVAVFIYTSRFKILTRKIIIFGLCLNVVGNSIRKLKSRHLEWIYFYWHAFYKDEGWKGVLFIYLLLYFFFELSSEVVWYITENDVMMKKGWSLLGVLSYFSKFLYFFFIL